MANREPTEMELRVAEALWNIREKRFFARVRVPFKESVYPARHLIIEDAIAAIRAMRESTNDMMNAGSSVIAEIHQQEIRGEEAGKRHLEEIPALRGSYRQEARESWRTMIEAASPPTTDNQPAGASQDQQP